jgi:hypothetical protein
MDLPPHHHTNSNRCFGRGGITANLDLTEKYVSIHQADLAAPYNRFQSDFDRESMRRINAVDLYSEGC